MGVNIHPPIPRCLQRRTTSSYTLIYFYGKFAQPQSRQ